VYWEVQMNFSDESYGLIHLDCNSFKKSLLKHISRLLLVLTTELLSEVHKSIENLDREYSLIRNKVDAQVDSIDEVIYLIEYIESLQKPNSKLEELQKVVS